MTNQDHRVGGIDSHKDTIHVAVITAIGQPVTDREFPTTVAGYRRAVAWLIEHGPLSAVGVEGTSSYGIGITTELLAAGIRVVEVNRTRAAEKRKQGKTDPLDAYRAARSVLSGEASTEPKNPSIEPLRALTIARRSAVKSQQAAWRQIGSLLVTTRPALRDRFRDLPETKLIATLRDCRPDQIHDVDDADTLYALRTLARRYLALQDEITALEERMLRRATRANPALMAIKGVGPAVGAQLLITAGDNPDRLRTSASFAALCGTAPIPVSSAAPTNIASPAAVTGKPTPPCTTSSKSACPTSREPAPTATPAWPTGGPRRRSSAPSNAPSHERSSTPWPATPSRPTTPTYDPHATRRTSPSPPPHNTSAYGPPESANSNSADAPTTNSPPATEPGSPPPETPPPQRLDTQ